MKKQIITVTLALMAISTLSFGADNKLEDSIRAVIPGSPIYKIKKSPIQGLYTVFTGDNILYVEPKQKLIFFGEIFEKSGASLTKSEMLLEDKTVKQARIDSITPKIIKDILSVAMEETKSGGRYSLLLFTNPQCPHCKDVEAFLSDKEINIYSILLGNPNEIGKYLSNEDIVAAYHNRKPASASSEEAMMRAEKMGYIARELQVSGTPTLFILDQKQNKVVSLIRGANSPEIQKWINENKKEAK